ncbi:rhodanese-like domain-containing protein [Pontixanthobacter aestiaquae]|uniref:Rhodanese-like domain-containing protein n=1 Tax=Pontixanthobacter aestiaquae TaxID=1509367 RepID=A0A844Z5G5_9SPHN|nr:rhodanese-like domain-containing protein [Pontixanthobacter aestiaquae]MDN3646506.1 rhodanese-like domain-containing protein [Pontixanthobacter aestiaquae]MXO82506.1 rhodanese-like domain-containing protein [Pontixanthobacter aestiaquae]
MRTLTLAIVATIISATPVVAQLADPQIDYNAFVKLTIELAEVREAHRLPLKEFTERSQAERAILLDTRSAAAFAEGHIAGAINLPFSDFTDEKLANVLGADQTRPIFIYCNNNFSDNIRPIVSKRAPLALNIPTFINLHGYGYTNVWELADVIPTSELDWVSAEKPEQTSGT